MTPAEATKTITASHDPLTLAQMVLDGTYPAWSQVPDADALRDRIAGAIVDAVAGERERCAKAADQVRFAFEEVEHMTPQGRWMQAAWKIETLIREGGAGDGQ